MTELFEEIKKLKQLRICWLITEQVEEFYKFTVQRNDTQKWDSTVKVDYVFHVKDYLYILYVESFPDRYTYFVLYLEMTEKCKDFYSKLKYCT